MLQVVWRAVSGMLFSFDFSFARTGIDLWPRGHQAIERHPCHAGKSRSIRFLARDRRVPTVAGLRQIRRIENKYMNWLAIFFTDWRHKLLHQKLEWRVFLPGPKR